VPLAQPLDSRFNPCLNAPNEETSARLQSFTGKMNSKKKKMTTATIDMDRRPIRIDMPPDHAGVMAALRRAFQTAASEPSDRDFADLLRKLN
jgi:hypothetical protein